jgi:excisionase family DNA binding protein
MSVKDAASKLGVSPSKVYELVSQRRLAHYRIGGKILFEDADVEAYRQSCRVGTATAGKPVVCHRGRLPVKLKHATVRG